MRSVQRPTAASLVTQDLEIAYQVWGPDQGRPVVLLHGFPYDVHAYGRVAPRLADAGLRVFVPYLRGYGPTRFLSETTPRSGEQAALVNDLINLIDGLQLDRPLLVGYDWGGRAACGAAAMRPDLVSGLVAIGGYTVFGPPGVHLRPDPAWAHRSWYMYLLHSDAGRELFGAERRSFCRYIWSQWSPTWAFDDEDFAASAGAFENPDFLAVVSHSYRHRAGLAPGDPDLHGLADALSSRPQISTPTLVLSSADDALQPLSVPVDRTRFLGPFARIVIPGAGHNLPQETPEVVVEAVQTLILRTTAPA